MGIIFSLLVLFAAFAAMNTPGLNNRAESAANTIVSEAEQYYVESGVYPNYRQLMQNVDSSDIPYDVTVGDLDTTADVIYIPCYVSGEIVWHW